jgi:hypothetical protein
MRAESGILAWRDEMASCLVDGRGYIKPVLNIHIFQHNPSGLFGPGFFGININRQSAEVAIPGRAEEGR